MRSLDEWLLGTTSPTSLAAFRAAFGLYLLGYFGMFLPDVGLLFSASGVYVPFLVPEMAPPAPFAWLLYAIWMAATIAFTVGYRARAATVLVLVLYLYHYLLNLAVKDHSYDRVIMMTLGILCFAETAGALAVTPSSSATKVPAWPRRLLCLEVSFVYLGTGLAKLFSDDWSGTAMRMNMHGPWGSDVSYWLVRQQLPDLFYDALATSVLWLEISMSVLLFIPKVQWLVFALGIAFHVSIACLLSIPEFLAMPAFYLLYARDSDLEGFVDWARGRLGVP